MEAMGLEFGGRAGTRKAFVAQPGEPSECTRSGFCNFMHLKPISRELRRELYGRRRRSRSRDRSERSDRSSGRRRSRSKERRRSRSRDRRDGRSGRY